MAAGKAHPGPGPGPGPGPRPRSRSRSRINDLSGREWKFWSRSVISKPYPPDLQHQLRRQHGGQKPPRLAEDLIRIFSREGARVLDPFAGVGGILLGASLAGRSALGIEIEPRWAHVYLEVARKEGLAPQPFIIGDSLKILSAMSASVRFDLVLTDLPYWNMDQLPKTRSRRAPRSHLSRFDSRSEALETGPSKKEWLEAMVRILSLARGHLEPGGYMLIFIGDLYRGQRYHFLSSDVARALEDEDLLLKANLIWYDVSKSLHVYGYPSAFVPSIIHQNILVFRRSR